VFLSSWNQQHLCITPQGEKKSLVVRDVIDLLALTFNFTSHVGCESLAHSEGVLSVRLEVTDRSPDDFEYYLLCRLSLTFQVLNIK